MDSRVQVHKFTPVSFISVCPLSPMFAYIEHIPEAVLCNLCIYGYNICRYIYHPVLNSQTIATACCLERGEPFLSGPTGQNVSFFRRDPQIFPRISLLVLGLDYVSQSQSIHMAKVRMHTGPESH